MGHGELLTNFCLLWGSRTLSKTGFGLFSSMPNTPGLEEILRIGRALDHCCAQGWSLLPAKERQRGSGWIREDQSGSRGLLTALRLEL